MGKLLVGLVSTAAGLFGATMLFWAGILFEHRPVGALSFHVWGPIGFTDPGGPAAQLKVLMVEEAKAATRAIAVENVQVGIVQSVGAQQVAAQTRIVTMTRTITHEIHDVVTPAVDHDFPLSVGFVRLHDAAARDVDVSDVASPAGQPDDSASLVKPSDLAATLTANYGSCRADAAELAAWQSFYALLRQAQAKPAAK